MSPATSMNPQISQSLSDYVQTIKSVMSSIQGTNLDSSTPAIINLQKIAFNLAKIFTLCTNEEASYLASAQWPQEFSLVKLSLQSDLNSNEEKFIGDVRRLYSEHIKHADFARHLLLARLLIRPSSIDHLLPWQDVPQTYLSNYIAYQLETYPLILPKDAEQDYHHYEIVLNKLYDFISSANTAPCDRDAALSTYLKGTNNISFRCADYNIRPIMVLINKIMRFSFNEALQGTSLDYTFIPRKTTGKIRLGIFAKTLMTGVETLALLNNINKLDRNRYHIILIHSNCGYGYYSEIQYFRNLFKAIDDVIQVDTSSSKNSVDQIRHLDLDFLWHQSHIGLMDTGWFGYFFLHKLARVQCTMASMNAFTTGNPYFQYYINHKPPFLAKIGDDEFSETEVNVAGVSIYIPDNWQQIPNQYISRESLNIPPDAIIYFSGAAASKYTPECVRAWINIINQVPNSYLILCPLNPGWEPQPETILAFHILLHQALRSNRDVFNRLRLIGHVNGEAIALMHQWSDIHLSTFPYGGVTTLSDSLRGGLCPVCISGHYSRSNGDASIMDGYDLLDLVTHTPEEYEKLAIRFGTDKVFRVATKKRVNESFAKRHSQLKEEIALSYAAVINQIVNQEFPGT